MRHMAVFSVVLAVLLSLLPEFAEARRVPANIGRQSNGGVQVCYTFGIFPGSVGVTRINESSWECQQQHFVLPIVWDSPSAPGVQRTIRVFGKAGSAGLNCTATIWLNGSITSSGSGTITSTSYSSVNIVVNNVPAGSHGSLACAANAGALLLGMEYSP